MNSPVLSRLLCVRGLRAFADGYVSLLLPLYLLALGMQPLQIGMIATGTLLGSGVLTLLVGLYAHHFTHRLLLLMAALLMTATGLGFAAFTDFWPLLVIAIVGTLNPSSGDVSVFLPLEHAVISGLVDERRRTAVFARYSLTAALAGALGALFAGAPDWIVATSKLDKRVALQAMFILYGVLGLASALIYSRLPREIGTDEHKASAAPLQQSKRVVYTLAALFSLDAFGAALWCNR
ncbi:MFS transporter [Pseudomonas batumici]|uniref:MFS transporter n=1 Tax=Pseudomonas batumici TaxID=226910 RepID=UPI0030D0F814